MVQKICAAKLNFRINFFKGLKCFTIFHLLLRPLTTIYRTYFHEKMNFLFFYYKIFITKKINLVQYKLESAQLIFFSDLCLPLTTAE